MRKVVAYELLSLDGVAEDCDQFILDWDEVMDHNLARVISTQDTVLLGHRMFDEWAAFWPTSEIQPFADFINGVEKYVSATTPLTSEWTQFSAIEGDLSDFVNDLRSRSGGDIGVHGSIELVQSLLKLDLVDEVRLVIAPALHMQGRRLFDGVPPRRLTLTRHITSPTGHLLLDYSVIR